MIHKFMAHNSRRMVMLPQVIASLYNYVLIARLCVCYVLHLCHSFLWMLPTDWSIVKLDWTSIGDFDADADSDPDGMLCICMGCIDHQLNCGTVCAGRCQCVLSLWSWGLALIGCSFIRLLPFALNKWDFISPSHTVGILRFALARAKLLIRVRA